MSETVKYKGTAKLVLNSGRSMIHQRDELFIEYLKTECPSFEPDFDGKDYYWHDLIYSGFLVINNDLYKLDNERMDLEESYTKIKDNGNGNIEYETVFYDGVETLSSVIEEGLSKLTEEK